MEDEYGEEEDVDPYGDEGGENELEEEDYGEDADTEKEGGDKEDQEMKSEEKAVEPENKEISTI